MEFLTPCNLKAPSVKVPFIIVKNASEMVLDTITKFRIDSESIRLG